jgi:hypothetical protein
LSRSRRRPGPSRMWAARSTKRSHVLCSSLVGSIIAFFSSRNRLVLETCPRNAKVYMECMLMEPYQPPLSLMPMPLGACQAPAAALPWHPRGALLEVWGSMRILNGGQSVYKSHPWEWRGPLHSPVPAGA